MNLNFLQTILTLLSTIALTGSTILAAFGCKVSELTGAIDCAASTAPAWLIPYLVMAAAALNILKLVIKPLQGKGAFTAPTIPMPKIK